MPHRYLPLVLIFASLTGCLSPFSTRLPEVVGRPAEVERRASQIKDPYPDSRLGPEVGFRPLEFQEQRAEPVNAKDRYYSGFVSRPRVSPTPAPAYPPGAMAPPM
ncbi:MAG: hypothetical protein KDA80_11225 [Planctomycetaceae bacterium]|nr:hypothetical protein [Planctomycetaceae bacterium]